MRSPNTADAVVRTLALGGETSPGRQHGHSVLARVGRGVLAASLLTCVACGTQEHSPSASPTSSTSPSSTSRALTAEEARAAASLRKAIRRNGLFFAGKERCVATGLVRELGIKELTAVGLLNQDLAVPQGAFVRAGTMSSRDANKAVDATFGCVNWRLFAMNLVGDNPHLQNTYDRRCTATITEDDVRKLYVGFFSGAKPTHHLPPIFTKLEQAGCGFEGDD